MPSSSTSHHARAPPSSSRDDHDSSDHKRQHRSDIVDHRRSKDGDTSSDRRKRHREDDDRDRHRSSKHSQNSRSHRDDDRRDKSDREHRRRDRDRDHGSSSHLRHDSDRDQYHRDRSSKRRETSEERRILKAAKRSEKLKQLEESFIDQEEEEGAAQRTAVAELMMYSAEDNPFNDPTLGQKFKWGKKEEKERKQGLSREEAEKRDAQRRQEAMAEIENLNAKRAEREKQAALREEEEARMARLAESAQMASWVAKEDDFHLEQAQRRAVIRVKENRAKPIDLLSINLKWADPNIIAEQENKQDDDDDDDDDEAGLEIDLEEPYTIFEDLTIEETEEFHQDIQMYLELEKNDSHRDFWRSMLIVCDDKLEELKEEQDRSKGGAANVPLRQDPEERGRINSMLEPKSTDELQQLQDQVRAKLASGEPVDVEYWERVLKSIVVWRAKARLGVLHEAVLSNRLEYLRRKQRDEAVRQQQELLIQTGEDSVDEQQEALDAQDTAKAEADAEEAALEALYDPDEMEPAAIDPSRLSYEDVRLAIKTLGEDLSELVAARRRVTGQLFIPKTRCNDLDPCSSSNPADRMFIQEASKALDVTEEIMPTDEALTHETYQWQDKYRPRKPRFLNRVHTGFDWNKYNQTHYDSDNPPPKTVQGYKFNIFYPDLIDKNAAPTYKVVKERGEEQTVLLRFSAGPPYEDVAFRIVNREWEYSHKRGFRNSFDRGVLQLHFNFKRLRYRK
ncbi:related to cactin [Ustilago sp. UG-2017b]|nr:related to cactin [Ustilago sp. UG-2017b]